MCEISPAHLPEPTAIVVLSSPPPRGWNCCCYLGSEVKPLSLAWWTLPPARLCNRESTEMGNRSFFEVLALFVKQAWLVGQVYLISLVAQRWISFIVGMAWNQLFEHSFSRPQNRKPQTPSSGLIETDPTPHWHTWPQHTHTHTHTRTQSNSIVFFCAELSWAFEVRSCCDVVQKVIPPGQSHYEKKKRPGRMQKINSAN